MTFNSLYAAATLSNYTHTNISWVQQRHKIDWSENYQADHSLINPVNE